MDFGGELGGDSVVNSVSLISYYYVVLIGQFFFFYVN